MNISKPHRGAAQMRHARKHWTVRRGRPQDPRLRAVLNCVARLHHTAAIARTAVDGPTPELAAQYIVETVADLRADLRTLREVVRQISP